MGRRKLLIGSAFSMGSLFAILAGMIKQIDEKSKNSFQYGIVASILCFLYMGVFTTGFQATGQLSGHVLQHELPLMIICSTSASNALYVQ